MRRADRLFQIVQHLRARRLTTARWLAERLEVSERTIYRDVQDLMLSGVPIEGEAGVGYALRHKLDLPPLSFDRRELDALKLGARMVAAWGDGEMGRAAELALAKIRSVMPDELQRPAHLPVYAPAIHGYPLELLGPIREAISRQAILQVRYRKPDGQMDERRLWPLGLFFWGDRWTLVAWCELRDDHRHFRLDRIDACETTVDRFQLAPHQNLASFMAKVGASPKFLD